MAKVEDLFEANLWKTGAIAFKAENSNRYFYSPREYEWLLNGDPEPFIKALNANPERYNYPWVQKVLTQALRGEIKRPKGRPKTSYVEARHRKALMIILQQMTRGKNQTDACRQAANEVCLSYDQVYKDVFKKFPNGIGLMGLLLEMIAQRYIEFSEVEKLDTIIHNLAIGGKSD